MLIEFTLGNYKSFKDKVTLSMVASPISEHPGNKFSISKKLSLLKSAGIYGANASGKSNLFLGLEFMKDFVRDIWKLQSVDKIPLDRFRFSTDNSKPSFFEVVFLYESKKYIYGFEAKPTQVTKEWLYYYPKTHPVKLFERQPNQEISISPQFKKAKKILENTNKNQLFLVKADSERVQFAQKVIDWFANKLNIISGKDSDRYRALSEQLSTKAKYLNRILKLIRIADPSIHRIETQKVDEKEIEKAMEKAPKKIKEIYKIIEREFKKEANYKTSFSHKKYGQKKDELESFLLHQESAGTIKMFCLAAPILMSLDQEGVLVVDELDTSLHPKLSDFIINLFNQQTKAGSQNPQLIFNTHESTLLKSLRRDQIWITEKDQLNSSRLVSWVEYKIRKDSSYEKIYLEGKVGGTPIIEDEAYDLSN